MMGEEKKILETKPGLRRHVAEDSADLAIANYLITFTLSPCIYNIVSANYILDLSSLHLFVDLFFSPGLH
jgi:hypothetical protein